jgi:CspA family cold shock protein
MTGQSEAQGARTLRGRVKWFDPSKGFGFIVADEGGPDILLHANVLRNFGQGSIADGAGIEILAQKTERGMQAVEVLSIEPPEPEPGAEPAGFGEAADLERAGPLEPARVKWYDKAKGFGFANVFGKPEDVFIHIEILRRSGLSDLQPGEAICLRASDGSRGRMAVQVFAWDSAVGKTCPRA